MTDEPRFLGTDRDEPTGTPAPPHDPTPEAGPTPEQRAAIEAVLAGRSDEIAPRHCIGCGSTECAPVYALLEHSSFEVDRRYKFMRTETIERSSLAPHVLPMCAACYAGVDANRRRARIAAGIGGLGLLIAMGYFVAALAKAPTAIALALLFGGGGLLAVMMVFAVASTRSLHQQLGLPKLPGISVLVVSNDRGPVLRHLEARKLISREIENELDRMASNASPPPAARVVSRE